MDNSCGGEDIAALITEMAVKKLGISNGLDFSLEYVTLVIATNICLSAYFETLNIVAHSVQ